MFELLGTDAEVDELRAFNGGLEQLLAAQPSVHTVPIDVSRRVRRAGGGIFPAPVFLPQARDVLVPARGGEVRVRVLAPPGEPRGVYVHLHGGGWSLGRADQQDPELDLLARETDLTVVSVDYRLAPEHPFPAAADDCEGVARWLRAGGAEELGAPARLTIGGESAGAHLAVLTLVRLRDGDPPAPRAFAAANLVFGSYDLAGTPSRRAWERDLVLSPAVMDWFRDMFVPGVPVEERRRPDVSPLYADLRDLPPALFSVGTLDPLLDDSLFMATRWRAAGNDAELRVWREAVHGFTAFPLAAARRSLAEQHAFLREAAAP